MPVEITDNGPGIPESCVDTVFNEGNTLKDSDGTGYGLPLVKLLANQYDGSIAVGDADPALGGTAVNVTLPIVVDDNS